MKTDLKVGGIALAASAALTYGFISLNRKKANGLIENGEPIENNGPLEDNGRENNAKDADTMTSTPVAPHKKRKVHKRQVK